VARTGAVTGRRSFDVVDLLELFTHREAGRSQAQIAESLNLDRKTISYADVGITRGLTVHARPLGDRA